MTPKVLHPLFLQQLNWIDRSFLAVSSWLIAVSVRRLSGGEAIFFLTGHQYYQFHIMIGLHFN